MTQDGQPPVPVPGRLARLRAVWRELAPARRQLRQDLFVCLVDTAALALLLLAGGAAFMLLEADFEQQIKCGVRRHQHKFLDDLWARSDQLDKRAWRALAKKHLADYEEKLLVAFSSGMTSYSGQRMWTLANSAGYAWTVITSMGYGHLAPPDTAGRAVTIIYALLGIPIFLIVLADYGKLFTRGLKYMLAAVYRLYHTKSCTWVRRTAPVENVVKGIKTVYEKTGLGSDEEDAGDQEGEAVISIDDEFNLPISLALFILLAYLLAGAILFALLEDWTYFDSFYFVFISMTTIGFGDMVPQSAGVMMCTTLYMIFGLALTSMCINVIQEKMTQHFKQASIKLGTRFGVSVPVTPAPVVVEVAPVHGKDN